MALHPKGILEGLTVLIIGAASLIGAYMIQGFLKFGYKVRATDYGLAASSWVVSEA